MTLPGRVSKMSIMRLPSTEADVASFEVAPADVRITVQFSVHSDFLAAFSDLVPAPPDTAIDGVHALFFARTVRPIKPGELVRVKLTISQPHFAWGFVSKGQVGVVTRIDGFGPRARVTVAFPRQTGWHGQRRELEVVDFRHSRRLHLHEDVTVHPAVPVPLYAWGAAQVGKVGSVQGFEPLELPIPPVRREVAHMLSDVLLRFADGPDSWRGVVYELQHAHGR
jgi:hypothetical protein|eukprot:gnl/Ergobibamus_cyprinoides/1747.p1 GENE.gnl/Ergobibamus_cyprinoides/1747~~gnl/Ergobibamus_cyprinoides/1747.p1  ORF type:complete len:255 (+),score=40.90 gnl/Ergobibamus_cyprinoides/1747:94-765(+)